MEVGKVYKIVERSFDTHTIRFILGDNMQWMKESKKQYDLAIDDPPYGIGEDGAKNKSRGKLAKATEFTDKNWDNNHSSKEFFKALKKCSTNQIIWGANHFIENIPKANSPCWIVWDKNNNTNDFADCELAYCSFDTAVRKFVWTWNGMIQHDMKNKESRIHPTQKPIKLYEWQLMKYAKPGMTIFDPHGGSGSIAIACHRMRFDLDIVELDEEYFEKMIIRFDSQPESARIEKNGVVETHVQTSLLDFL